LGEDDEIRAIVMGSTSDRFFCTGRDVVEVAKSDSIAADVPWGRYERLTVRHAEVWKPVVCAVEGLAVGGGLHFVTDADIVVASENATFLDSHVNVGVVGALENMGLALKVGLGMALYLTVLGKSARLSAERAFALGLVQEVVPPGTALERALELADIISSNSPSAVSKSLEAIWTLAYAGGYEQAQRYGWLLVRRQWSHPDASEGPRAFAEKRPPRWRVP
jgi:enoyl-CoA hydratase/carnithine racemase